MAELPGERSLSPMTSPLSGIGLRSGSRVVSREPHRPRRAASTRSLVFARLAHAQREPPATSFFGKLFGRRANSLDPDPWHETLVALHSTYLIVGTHEPKRGTTVLCIPLLHASVQRGSAIAARLGMAVEDGLTIDGFPGYEGRPVSYFVGLGPEAAANHCFESIEAAVRTRQGIRRADHSTHFPSKHPA